jgi:hypothetical protein
LCELIKFKYLNWKNIFMPIEFSFPKRRFDAKSERRRTTSTMNWVGIFYLLNLLLLRAMRRMEAKKRRIIPPFNNFICYPRWSISCSSSHQLESRTYMFAEMCNIEQGKTQSKKFQFLKQIPSSSWLFFFSWRRFTFQQIHK